MAGMQLIINSEQDAMAATDIILLYCLYMCMLVHFDSASKIKWLLKLD